MCLLKKNVSSKKKKSVLIRKGGLTRKKVVPGNSRRRLGYIELWKRERGGGFGDRAVKSNEDKIWIRSSIKTLFFLKEGGLTKKKVVFL